MEQEEIWKDIEGYERLYQVSNMGRVRSLDSYDRLGRLHSKGKILRPGIRKDGYLQVCLYKEGKLKTFLIHRLVAQVFIKNPEGLPEINHRDEDKTNNLVDNLEWCDRFYNMRYGTRNERMIQTRIRKGLSDPETCGIQAKDKKEYHRLYMREYRRRKKSA